MTYQVRPLQLNANDFRETAPELRRSLQQLSDTLNPYLRDVQNGFQSRLTVDNLAAVVKQVTFVAPSMWVPLDLGGSVTVVEQPYAMRGQDGLIRLKGVVVTGSSAYNTQLFSLPTGFAPAAPGVAHTAPYISGTTVSFLRIRVLDDGLGYADPANTLNRHILTGALFAPAVDAPVVLPSPFPLLVDISALGATPRGVVVLDCENLTTNSPAGSLLPQITWDCAVVRGTSVVRISNATGLIENNSYRLTVLVVA